MNIESVPRAVWWTVLGVMPIIIAGGLLLIIFIISAVSVESEVPVRALFVAVVMYLLATTVRTTMSCVDWLEARAAKKAERNG